MLVWWLLGKKIIVDERLLNREILGRSHLWQIWAWHLWIWRHWVLWETLIWMRHWRIVIAWLHLMGLHLLLKLLLLTFWWTLSIIKILLLILLIHLLLLNLLLLQNHIKHFLLFNMQLSHFFYLAMTAYTVFIVTMRMNLFGRVLRFRRARSWSFLFLRCDSLVYLNLFLHVWMVIVQSLNTEIVHVLNLNRRNLSHFNWHSVLYSWLNSYFAMLLINRFNPFLLIKENLVILILVILWYCI